MTPNASPHTSTPTPRPTNKVRRRLAVLPLLVAAATTVTVVLLGNTITDLTSVGRDFTQARDQADLVPYVQRELLRFEQELTEAAVTADMDDVITRADFLLRQLDVSSLEVSTSEQSFMKNTWTEVDAIRNGPLANPPADDAALSDMLLDLSNVVEERERTLKQLFDGEVRAFDKRAEDAIAGNARTQLLLAGLIGGTILLSASWALAARRRAHAHLTAASHALLSSEERFRSFVQLSSDVTIVIDHDGNITYASPASATVLGMSPESLDGCLLRQLVHPADAATVTIDSLVSAANATSTAGSGLTFRVQHGDGSWRVVEARARALDGKLRDDADVVLLNLRDMTDQVRLESDLRHAQKLESVGQLAAGIAHEINTPIQFVGDNVRFLNDAFQQLVLSDDSRSLPADDREFLLAEVPEAISQTLDGIDRVATIVRAMRAFGHPGDEEKTPVDLNAAVETTLVVAANELKFIAEVTTKLDTRLPMVLGHTGDINQVLLNLIVNAAHAVRDVYDQTRQRGQITVSTRVDGTDAVIDVADTGSGIASEIAERVFEPFFTTKPVGSGTGQGLSLAYSLVTDRHQGSITFESAVDHGTTFTIRLPITPTGERPSGNARTRRLTSV